MATLQTPSDNSHSFEDFQNLLTRPYINSNSLSQAHPDKNEFYLGSSFNDVESIGQVAVGQLFPCMENLHFMNSLPLKPIREKCIRTWPKTNVSFRRWHARMANHGPTKAIFDPTKISDLLEITLQPPIYDSVFFPIALSF